MDKKWALPLGLALVALLILWGSLGMGTASKLFPEKTKAMPPVDCIRRGFFLFDASAGREPPRL